MTSFFAPAWSIVLFLVTLAAHAGDVAPAWSVKGFGTFSASGTDTDRLGFRRDTTQANGVTRSWGIDPDSRLGLQFDVDFNESWHLGLQWVARDHAGDFFEQNLDWAYLRWRALTDLDVRIGRLGFDVFMLSDYRNVGYAYLWIRPPHEFYGSLSPYHFDGADIALRYTVAAGLLTIKGYGGQTFLQLPILKGQTLDQRIAVAGGSALYEQGDWRFRVGYAYSRVLTEGSLQSVFGVLDSPALNTVWPGARSLLGAFSVQGKEVHFSSIGLAYDDGLWMAQLEGAYTDSNTTAYPSLASGYLSLGRRFGRLTPFVLLGIAETLRDPVKIPDLRIPLPAWVSLRNTVDRALNGNGIDEKSVSLGVRWDVYENIALKAQWNHFWLGQNGTQLWVEPSSGGPTPPVVNVWSVGVDFMF